MLPAGTRGTVMAGRSLKSIKLFGLPRCTMPPHCSHTVFFPFWASSSDCSHGFRVRLSKQASSTSTFCMTTADEVQIVVHSLDCARALPHTPTTVHPSPRTGEGEARPDSSRPAEEPEDSEPGAAEQSESGSNDKGRPGRSRQRNTDTTSQRTQADGSLAQQHLTDP